MINLNDPSYQQIRTVIVFLMNNKETPLQDALKLFGAVADNLESEAKSTHDGVHKSITGSLNKVYVMNKKEAG